MKTKLFNSRPVDEAGVCANGRLNAYRIGWTLLKAWRLSAKARRILKANGFFRVDPLSPNNRTGCIWLRAGVTARMNKEANWSALKGQGRFVVLWFTDRQFGTNLKTFLP